MSTEQLAQALRKKIDDYHAATVARLNTFGNRGHYEAMEKENAEAAALDGLLKSLAAHEAEKAQAAKVPFPDATPLLEFREGQWWVKELDLLATVSSGSKVEVTPDMKRAVSVVHELLRAVANHRAAPAAPAAVPMWQQMRAESPEQWERFKAWQANELPKGFVPLQKEGNTVVYAACLDPNARHYKWLMWRHPDGHWVSKRKLEAWEVTQVEDQEHYGIVQEGGQG